MGASLENVAQAAARDGLTEAAVQCEEMLGMWLSAPRTRRDRSCPSRSLTTGIARRNDGLR